MMARQEQSRSMNPKTNEISPSQGPVSIRNSSIATGFVVGRQAESTTGLLNDLRTPSSGHVMV
jgi:hypothetical protein